MGKDQGLPPWNGDALSKYFADAEFNDRVSALNYPKVFALLQRVQQAFGAAESSMEKDTGGRVLSRFLFVRAHSAFLAACRLAMSGQFPEAHAVLRTCLELSWYSLHIARDPAPFQRAEIWLRRNENPAALQLCKQTFTVAAVRATHEALDKSTATDIQSLYEQVIDFGAHPNQLGVLAAVHRAKESEQITYQVGILYPEELPMMFSLRLAVASAVGALKVFGLVYPERFTHTALDKETDALVDEVNTIFKPYAK